MTVLTLFTCLLEIDNPAIVYWVELTTGCSVQVDMWSYTDPGQSVHVQPLSTRHDTLMLVTLQTGKYENTNIPWSLQNLNIHTITRVIPKKPNTMLLCGQCMQQCSGVSVQFRF